MISSKKDTYAKLYLGIFTGYFSHIGWRIGAGTFDDGYSLLVIVFIYVGFYYYNKFYLSKKEFQIPRWIDIIIALVLPLSMFVSDKTLWVGLLLLPYLLRIGDTSFQDNLNWISLMFIGIFTYCTSFFLAGDYANITILLESERLHIIVPTLITYYLFVIIFFYYLRMSKKKNNK